VAVPEKVAVNDLKPVSLDVTNLGQAPAVNVVVTPKVPDGLGVGRTEPPVPENEPVAWKLGTLEPGQTRSVKFELRPREAGPFILPAQVSAHTLPRQPASASRLVDRP